MTFTSLTSGVLLLGLIGAAACETGSVFGQDSMLEQTQALAELTPAPNRYVLSDEALPSVAFADPAQAQRLLGAHRLTPHFYNSTFERVTKASAPGRYGCVVEIVPEDAARALPTRRFFTLFRLPGKDVLEAQSPALVARLKALRWNFENFGGADKPDLAIDLAALCEVPRDASPDNFYQQSWEKDRQWWIGLKRKLYGFDRAFPEPFVGPLPLVGKPAPVLRVTTPAEAGFLPDTAECLDKLLIEWAADSDTGCDVCIARRGVIVLHKAYGSYRGKPVTTTTPTALTSTSKMITATALMMLVDQGRLELDRPITDLPGPLHGIPTQRPVTLRGMYSHTAFSAGIHPTADMAERVAQVLPHLPIGSGYQYTGTSLEMAWEFASLATNESLSAFAKTHLLDPLGCTQTEVRNTGGSTNSTSLDVARICQMLQNRGAYGDRRYLRPETFEELLPRRHVQTLGPYSNDKPWGIGTHPWKVEGLSHFTFGHAGYFKSTVFIDPVHELVVVMLRTGAGTNYEKYHPRFLKTIVEGLAERLPPFPEALTLSGLEAPLAAGRMVVETVVENTSPVDAVLEFRYDTADTSWRFEPDSARLAIPAGSRVPVRVVAHFDRAKVAPLPKLRGAVYFSAGPLPPAPHVEYWLRPTLRPSLTAARVGKPPTCDGRLDSEEYGRQPAEQALLETHGRKTPAYATRFRVAYDDDALYVAVTAAERKPRELVAARKERDDVSMKREDYLELLLDAAGDGKTRRQFAVHLSGAQLDALGGDLKWNSSWRSAAGVSEDQIVYEFAIPYAALGATAPQPGDRWRLNLSRGRGPRDPKWELYSQWAMNYADFNNATHWGELSFK